MADFTARTWYSLLSSDGCPEMAIGLVILGGIKTSFELYSGRQFLLMEIRNPIH